MITHFLSSRLYKGTVESRIPRGGWGLFTYVTYCDLACLETFMGKWRKTSPLATSFGLEPHKCLVTTYQCLLGSNALLVTLIGEEVWRDRQRSTSSKTIKGAETKLIVFYNLKFPLKVKYKPCVNSSLINWTSDCTTFLRRKHCMTVKPGL